MQDLTVGDLKKILGNLPDDMPVRREDYLIDEQGEKDDFDKICQVYKAADGHIQLNIPTKMKLVRFSILLV